MGEDILFEITKDNLETGMRGYPVGFCPTSFVDPYKGLFYRGEPISELYLKSPEEVIFLLYKGHEPSDSELSKFKKDLCARAHLSQAVIKHIQMLPRQGHPMKLFCSALLILGMFEARDDYQEDCLNVIAKLPALVATVINYHAGWGETPSPEVDLGYMENFAHMLQVPGVSKGKLVEVMRLFNILHYDHGGGNLSTFVGKAVASGLEDMFGSLCSAMCGLAGPRHGRANQDCLEFVKEVLDAVGETASLSDVEQLIRDRLSSKQLVFGFGHAVLRAEDARATIFYDYSQKHFADHPLVKIALLLREAGPKVLKENPKISNPYPNVDAMSGTVLTAAGFGFPEYYTVLFGLSRCVGIATQIVYERTQARDGKGTPIVRPKYIYKPIHT
ncbi:MAG TPA: citrate (Si)-synthase [Chlamydiales bacterium]|nr:citrate (Si)-synthase [Chlamydiales bacterium]HPE84681.1 citrate (Si)-synthase [Chlamydiales bacterium]